MNIALLQLPELTAPCTPLLEKYFQTCKKQKVQIVAFGEYIFNPFYHKLCAHKPAAQVAHTSAHTLDILHTLSKAHKLDIIAPIVLEKENKLYKTIALIQGSKSRFYYQQRLIAYPHWNEKAFFANPTPKHPKTPLIFKKNNFKIAVIAGFEVHFDEIWLKLKQSQVDIVILPCSNTFASKIRWRRLCQMRAFTNSMAILRINRIGNEHYEKLDWQFYGDSLWIDANGDIEESLGDKEGMLLASLELKHLRALQQEWGFRA